MTDKLRTFWSPELEKQFMEAYEEVFKGWPVPFDDLIILTRYGETHVVASGSPDATPVILLNPGGGSAAIWRYIVEPLSQHYRTYAVDVIGEMNKSISVKSMRNDQEFIEWMCDLLDGLHIKQTHIVGNSNGGFFSLLTALFLPERINKVVLVSPAATFVQMWAWWFHLMIPAHMIAPIIHSEGMVMNAYDWLWQDFPKDPAYAKLHKISKIVGYPRYRPTRNSVTPRVFKDEELRKIHNPVLLLIGDHEVIYKPEAVFQRAKQLVPDIRTFLVPDANHCAQYTAPDFVNQKILEFLAE